MTGPVRWILIAAMFAASVLAGACNILGPAAYILHGPPRTDAVYELPDRKTLVFVDDRDNKMPRGSIGLRREVAETTSIVLMKQKVLTETIDPGDAIAIARQSDRHQEVMPIDAIGRTVGADLVIYVEVIDFRDSPDGYTPKPSFACAVKVLDLTENVRLFPPPGGDQAAQVITYSMPPLSTELYTSERGRMQVQRAMAVEMGDRVAKLFYDHETKELGRNLR